MREALRGTRQFSSVLCNQLQDFKTILNNNPEILFNYLCNIIFILYCNISLSRYTLEAATCFIIYLGNEKNDVSNVFYLSLTVVRKIPWNTERDIYLIRRKRKHYIIYLFAASLASFIVFVFSQGIHGQFSRSIFNSANIVLFVINIFSWISKSIQLMCLLQISEIWTLKAILDEKYNWFKLINCDFPALLHPKRRLCPVLAGFVRPGNPKLGQNSSSIINKARPQYRPNTRENNNNPCYTD